MGEIQQFSSNKSKNFQLKIRLHDKKVIYTIKLSYRYHALQMTNCTQNINDEPSTNYFTTILNNKINSDHAEPSNNKNIIETKNLFSKPYPSFGHDLPIR